MQNPKNRKRAWLWIALAVVLIAAAGAAFWLLDDYDASEPAMAALEDDAAVQVAIGSGRIDFVPPAPRAGLIFYPGGKVEPAAYAPLLRMLAEDGILCVLAEMPANLAVLDTNAADGVREDYPQITDWYLCGHSLGGAVASIYASKHADEFRGLILLAAYASEDLSQTGLRVLSVYGSEDGVLNMEKYEAAKALLPADSAEVVIRGGCHAYFGDYGAQDGDGEPTVTREEQLAQTVSAIDTFLFH